MKGRRWGYILSDKESPYNQFRCQDTLAREGRYVAFSAVIVTHLQPQMLHLRTRTRKNLTCNDKDPEQCPAVAQKQARLTCVKAKPWSHIPIPRPTLHPHFAQIFSYFSTPSQIWWALIQWGVKSLRRQNAKV